MKKYFLLGKLPVQKPSCPEKFNSDIGIRSLDAKQVNQ